MKAVIYHIFLLIFSTSLLTAINSNANWIEKNYPHLPQSPQLMSAGQMSNFQSASQRKDSLPKGVTQAWLESLRDENGAKIMQGEYEPDFIQRRIFDGFSSNEYFGCEVSMSADVNGDGFNDIAIGATYNNPGRVYLYFGGPNVDSEPDVILNGETDSSEFGYHLSLANVNGDSYGDLIVGASHYNSNTGRVYVFYGGAPLDTIADVTMTGENTGDLFGICRAADMNNDGYDDIIIGADGNSSNKGKAYIYFGGAPMNNVPDVIVNGQGNNDHFGISVSSAGDVNKDGFDDVIVGAHYAGKAYIFFGGASVDASADVTLQSGEPGLFGIFVSNAGDFNGDGFSDVIVSADRYNGNMGRTYVFYGGSLMDGSADVTMTGESSNDFFGCAISSAGDINKDGYSDVVVVAYIGGIGKVYVYFGNSTMNNTADIIINDATFASEVAGGSDVTGDGNTDFLVGAFRCNSNRGRVYLYDYSVSGNITSNSSSRVLTGPNTFEYFGSCVSSGDMNGDGYNDVVIGSGDGHDTGKAYIFFGGAIWDTIPDIVMLGEPDSELGISVSSADVNKDGYSDAIFGAGRYNSDAGRVYILFGGPSMDNVPDRIMTGEPNSMFGMSVSSAGDVNKDGYPDLIVGASQFSSNKGRAYIYYGGSPMDTIPDVIMDGESANNYFGTAVSSAGDVNKDGYSDVIVGARGYLSNVGKAYIFYGEPSMDATADIPLVGEGGYFGESVSSAGDVNGDGFSDVLVGAYRFDSNKGKVYLFYGGSSMNNSADYTFIGSESGAFLGNANTLASAGDLNKDGFSDIIMAEPFSGKAYVYFGGASMDIIPDIIKYEETPGENLVAVSAGGDINGDGHLEFIIGTLFYNSYTGKVYVYDYRANGEIISDLVLNGEETLVSFGAAVSSAGDVNNDGYDDFIVGSPEYTTTTDYGRAYIYYGGALLDNVADVTMTGEGINNNFGCSVSSAGDVNNDGYSDVIVGAGWYSTNVGRAYIFLGGANMDNSPDVVMTGEGGHFGVWVSSAGNVNGDLYSDVIVGAYRYGSSTGRAYIFYGGASMNNTADVVMNGEASNDLFGMSVSTAGDVNGDGFSDVIVGSAHDFSEPSKGKAHIFFGGASMDNVADVKMVGEQLADNFGFSVSTAGDVNGDGFSDVAVGASEFNGGKGKAFIYFGGTLMDTTADVLMTGASPTDVFGGIVASLGDMNNDGYSDLIVGSEHFESDRGMANIFFGGAQMNNVADITLVGEAPGDDFGLAVSSAGDVNSDGFPDVIVGAQGYNSFTGKSYLYLASAIGSPSNKEFRTRTSGNWNSPLTWEMSTNGGSNWISAPSSPDNTSDEITIQNSHIISITESDSAYNLILESGSSIAIDSLKSLNIKGIGGIGLTLNTGGVISGKGSIFINGISFLNNGLVSVREVNLNNTTSISGLGSFDSSNIISVNGNATLGSNHQFGRLQINSGAIFNILSYTLKLSGSGSSLSNAGSFLILNGSIEYNGTSPQIISAVNINYANLKINNAAGVIMNTDFSISGLLSISNGDLNLNGYDITLLDSARLQESPGNTLMGDSGSISTTRFINSPYLSDIGGLGIIITSYANFGMTTISRKHGVQFVDTGKASVSRFFDISPSNNSALNANLIFRYDNSEIDTLQESSLGLYSSTDGGTSYVYEGGVVDTSNNMIFLNHIHSFSRLTAARRLSGVDLEDSISVGNIYAKGKVCIRWGSMDNISARINKNILMVDDSVKVNYMIKNMETFEIIFDTLITIPEFQQSDTLVYLRMPNIVNPAPHSVIVQAIIDELDPINGYDLQTYCFDVTCNEFSYTEPCDTMDGGTGFDGSLGRMAVGFTNLSPTEDYPIYALDYSFNDSSYVSSQYKLAVYLDNGSGKPGEALYISPLLYSPGGKVSLTHDIVPPVKIPPGKRFYVGYIQTSGTNIKASYQNEIPVRINSFFFSNSDSNDEWYDFADSSKNYRLDISPKTVTSMTLNALLQGFFNSSLGYMIGDTIRLQVKSFYPPYDLIDEDTCYLDSNGIGNLYFTNVRQDSSYRFVIQHRNHLETWSNNYPEKFDVCKKIFNFTDNITKAFGNNMTAVGDKFAIYSGDVNQDDAVDGSDLLLIDNDAAMFKTGYLDSDLNGDEIIDGADAIIADNNAAAFISTISP